MKQTQRRKAKGRAAKSVLRLPDRTAVPGSLQPCAPQNSSAGEYAETRGYCPADNRCKIFPCYTSFDPRGRK